MKPRPLCRLDVWRVLLTFLLIPSLFWLSSCAVLYHGSNQVIPVTSNPKGVEVYVDGERVGVTPLEVELARASSHTLLLRHGDLEREVIITNTLEGGMVALDLIPAAAEVTLIIVASIPGPPPEPCTGPFCIPRDRFGGLILIPDWVGPVALGVTLLIGATPIVVDAVTGAWYELSPNEVFVDFEATDTQQ